MDSNDSAWLQALCVECAFLRCDSTLENLLHEHKHKHKRYKHVRLVLVRYK